MRDRIRQIMEAQHMTQQTFANFIGMSAASLSSIFNNRTKPTLNTVEAIKSKIPNLSIEWLMFGHGSMYEEEHTASSPATDNGTGGGTEQASGFAGGASDDLFSMAQEQRPQSYVPRQQPAQPVKPEIRYVERPQRQITEIRVYFDDLTYETFVPKK